jgi:hypothetical protein
MKIEPVPKIVRQLLELEVGERGYHVVFDDEDVRLVAKRLRSAYGQHGRRSGRGRKYRVLAFIEDAPIEVDGNAVVVVDRIR